MSTEAVSPTLPSARPALVALAAIVLYWVAEIVAQMGYYGPGGEIAVWGIQSALAQSAVVVAGLLLGHAIVGRIDLVLRSTTLVFLLGAFLNALIWFWVSAWQIPSGPEVAWRVQGSLGLLPQFALLIWLLRAPLRRWVLSGLAVSAFFLASHELVARYLTADYIYFVPDQASGGDYVPVDVEALYAAQDRLMSEQLPIAAGEAGKPEVFGLFLGGTSYQSVFLTEVESVAGILDGHYGSGPRSIRLANSSADPERYPMANRANLERALTEIGKRQGPEDVAFLFLTSHGQKDSFSLAFYEAGTTDLTANDFAGMLDRSRIGPAVIVVSACYSGSFIDDIAAPDRLIITAARTDRTSFGCRDGAEWTEFGQSFFDLALRSEPDPRKAFAIAVEDVARKETASDLTQSEPQISEGAEIGEVLDRLLAALGAPGN